MNEGLRTTQNKEEILSVLMEAMIKQITITLWQVTDGQRMILEGVIIGLEDEITIRVIKNEMNNISFQQNMVLYLHGIHRSILFKQEILSISRDLLVLKFPDEIRLMELRKNPRYYYQYAEGREVVYFAPQIDKKKDVASTLIDLSKGGVGLIMAEDRLKLIKIGDLLVIKKISEQQIPSDFQGKISHYRVYKRGNVSRGILYLVGVQFLKALDQIIYRPEIRNEKEIEEKRRNLSKFTDTIHGMAGQAGEFFMGYSSDQLKNLLHDISLIDEKLANQIKDNLNYLSGLRYMTALMKQTLLRQMNIEEVAMGLRLCESSLIQELLADTSQTVRAEFYAALQGKRSAKVVKNSQDILVSYLKRKEALGEFIFSASGNKMKV